DHSGSFNSRQSIGTTTSDENVQLLKCMGFLDENEIRQALEIAKNDLNEALTILTSEKAPYLDESEHLKASNLEMDLSDQHFDHTKFPLECLVALESNLYSDNWTVSYNKNEWLDRLLKSSIHFTGTNRFQDSDEATNYGRFVTKSLPEYFKRLLESTSVNKWSDKIQQGVHSMILLCLDLIQTKLKSTNRDNLDIFLDLLASIFNPKIEFNRKNSYRLPSVQKSEYQSEQPNGWILDFINEFANLNGFDNLIRLIETSDLNESNLILKPIALCIEYLNEPQLKLKLEEPFKVLIQSLSNIESLGQFKNKVNLFFFNYTN
ncbi:ubiquitin carboxyl-terminal hydrolase 24, partial [Brachionus plicatilis]